MNSWNGDLEDDCSLERYGMLAHVECMDKGYWWFGISAVPWVKGQNDLYNTADNQKVVRLTTGKMARAAAECCLELLNSLRPNVSSAPYKPHSIPSSDG